jgi:hypothetical protein
MAILTEAVRDYIGTESAVHEAPEPVEYGAVRRFAQAIMDEDPIFDLGHDAYGGPVAPPLFPQMMFKRPFGSPDPLQENARNPNYDGASGGTAQNLPAIPDLRGMGVLNGGLEIEFMRYARHGEMVRMRSRYDAIEEKQTSKGPIILLKIVSEYFTEADDVLLRIRQTSIRRPV